MKDFTYFDVVMASLKRSQAVRRVERQHYDRWPESYELMRELIAISDDNWETDEELSTYFKNL